MVERTLLACDSPLSTAYDLAILDLDGVVYLGPRAVPGAADAVRAAQIAGMKYCYLTNNASRSATAIAAQLRDLNLPATDGDVVTSAQVAARLLADSLPAEAPVLVIGGAGLVEALRECNLQPRKTFDDPQGPPQAVVQGFSPDLTWRDLAEGARAVRAGLPWTATNLDLTFPTEHGPAPGNGSLVRAVAAAANRCPDQVAGKPAAAPFHDAAARYGAHRPLVVGDRLDTDLEGAVNADMDSLAVLTGVSRPADLLSAPPGMRPTYLSYDLSGLSRAHPRVELSATAASCRDSRLQILEGNLRVQSVGRPIDLLRAGCALAWRSVDEGTPVAIDEVANLLAPIEGDPAWEQSTAIP